eukprot:8053778-Lingulodinium_polyedra.AAC.1
MEVLVSQGCPNGVPIVFQWRVNGVSMVSPWCPASVSWLPQWCLDGVSLWCDIVAPRVFVCVVGAPWRRS